MKPRKSVTLVNELLRPTGFHIDLTEALPLWLEDPRFSSWLPNVDSHTLLDHSRLFVLYQTAVMTADVPGDVAEAGVAAGGSALLLSKLLKEIAPRKILHLFDSFAGLPSPTLAVDGNHHVAGRFASNVADVEKYLRSGGADNWRTHPGWFENTLHAITPADGGWSFVHVDADLYDSVKSCLDAFLPHMHPGGVVVLDDYGFFSTPGVRKAVRDRLGVQKFDLIYLPTGQALLFARKE